MLLVFNETCDTNFAFLSPSSLLLQDFKTVDLNL